jgi:hypothetical protein
MTFEKRYKLMIRKTSSKSTIQTYPLGKWDFLVIFVCISLAGLFLLLTWTSIKSCEYLNSVTFVFVFFIGIVGLTFLAIAYHVKRLGKRSIVVGPTGIAKNDNHGNQTFIRWDEIGDFSTKNCKFGLSPFLFDQSGKRKILIGGLREYPLIRERVFSEFLKRMPSPSLPQTFKWFPNHSLVITRNGIQIQDSKRTETIAWLEIDRLDMGTKISIFRRLIFLKITAKDGNVYFVQGRQVLSNYLTLRKILQKQKSYHPTPLPEQKEPWGRVVIYGALWGILWINFHFSMFKFIPLGLGNIWLWVWIFSFILFFFIIIKLAGRERLWPQIPTQKPVRQFSILFSTGLFSMTVGAILTWALWEHLGQTALDKAKKDVAAAGYSFEMPKNEVSIPEKENSVTYLKMAAEAKSIGPLQSITNPLWKKAFYGKKTEYDFLVDFQIHAREGTLSLEEMLYAKKLLKSHTDILQLLDTAYEKQKVDWGMDFTIKPSYDIKIPTSGPTMNFSRLLLCQAVVQARDGRLQEALRSIKTGLFIGEAEGRKSFSIDILIHGAVCKIMIDAIHAIEPFIDPRVEEKDLLPFLNPQELNDEFMKSIQMNYFATKEGWYEKFTHKDYKASYMLDAASYYEAQIQKLNAFKLPYAEIKKAWDKSDQDYQKQGWMFGLMWDDMNFPDFYRLQQTITYCRLAHAAAEARLFHLKFKRWPDALWELDKKNWNDYLDPFTDHYNLRIMRYGNGILIYSVGPQGQDNQGMPLDLKNNYYPFNFGWVVNK